jgi:chromosome partitioning protein
MNVTLLNQQGGVGEMTSALHLAGGLCQGQRVAVIDANPQGPALEWSEMRKQERFPRHFGVIGFARDTLHCEAPNIARDRDRVADGLPQIAAITRAALPTADLVLVPVLPPPFDGSAFAENPAVRQRDERRSAAAAHAAGPEVVRRPRRHRPRDSPRLPLRRC